MTIEAAKAYSGWAIVELMGHVRLAGRVSEEPMFGTALLRIDVPEGDGYTTQYASGGSIYRLTPCSEEVARAVVGSSRPMPIEPWEMRRLERPRAIEARSVGEIPFVRGCSACGSDHRDIVEASDVGGRYFICPDNGRRVDISGFVELEDRYEPDEGVEE